MKKVVFISALLIGLLCTFNTKKVSADDDHLCISYQSGACYLACKESAFSNTDSWVQNFYGQYYTFIKPVIVIDVYQDGTAAVYLFAKPPITAKQYDSTSTATSIYLYSFTTNNTFDASLLQYYDVPVFYRQNISEASKYSQDLAYDDSTVVGGLPFSTPTIGSEYYENKIYHFEKVWNVYSRPTTRMSWNIAWIQNYDNDLYESSDYHRQVGITVKYPDYTSIANLYDSVFNEPQSFATTLEYAKSFFTYDHLYDSRLTYKETTIWVDIDDMINDYEANGSNSEWANWFHLTQNVDKGEFNFTMYETLENALTASNWGQSYSYNPKGMVNIFRQYYNNDKLLLFALPFCIFEKAQMFTFNEPLNIVYNPIYIFWFDATAPDGTRSEKRNFGNPTNITSDNLVEPDDSNNNLGVQNGVPNPSEQQLASNYSSSIQDSYNNIYNNYYYTSSQNQDLLDYLMKYKDGGTEQDVQDAFGYVNTTIDSVSNVPVMLGKLFTGFFPPKVIMLFSALFIIFAVFIIVKIIRHLFL